MAQDRDGAASQLRSEESAYSIFMLVRTTPAWLALKPEARFEWLDEHIQPLLAKYSTVKMKFWDTEHFNARISDVIMFETQDLAAYRMLIERMRETDFWDTYFQIVEILPGIENAYADAYDVKPY